MRLLIALHTLCLGIVLMCSKASFAQNAAIPASSTVTSPGNDSDYVYIRQRISADYQNTAGKLAKILKAPVEKEIFIKSGDTLSQVISKEYKVGVSNAPAAYQLFAKSILTINKIPQDGILQSNTNIRIPNLPPLAATNPNPHNQNNEIPKLSVEADILAKQPNLSQQGTRTPNVIFDEGRKGAQEVVMIQRVPRAYAAQLVHQNPDETQVVNDHIPIDFAQASGPATAQSPSAIFLSSEDTTTLRRKLARAASK
ncbi:hypothetical protein [Paraburkholderia sp. JPY419]|uniref:hypothetical protein n=1 Tax=Paraburkholderia sp. JPY419 TaxID=667660 RepID=UPI003D1C5D26